MEGPQGDLRRHRLQRALLYISQFRAPLLTRSKQAIKTGYRLFDGAYDYQNEKEAGEGIKRAISDGLVKREDIFITTKLWNNYHRKDIAIDIARKQNEIWGLGYIDLFLIHFPVALKYIEPEKRRYPVSILSTTGSWGALLTSAGLVAGRGRHH